MTGDAEGGGIGHDHNPRRWCDPGPQRQPRSRHLPHHGGHLPLPRWGSQRVVRSARARHGAAPVRHRRCYCHRQRGLVVGHAIQRAFRPIRPLVGPDTTSARRQQARPQCARNHRRDPSLHHGADRDRQLPGDAAAALLPRAGRQPSALPAERRSSPDGPLGPWSAHLQLSDARPPPSSANGCRRRGLVAPARAPSAPIVGGASRGGHLSRRLERERSVARHGCKVVERNAISPHRARSVPPRAVHRVRPVHASGSSARVHARLLQATDRRCVPDG